MSIKKKKTTGTGNYNSDTIKLLVTLEGVAKKIEDIRKEIGIKLGGFMTEKKYQAWYTPVLNSHIDGTDKKKRLVTLYRVINEILDEHGLTKDSFPPLWSYICLNKINLRIGGNIEIRQWIPSGEEAPVVEVEIFRKPSIKDLREMRNTIVDNAMRYLPIPATSTAKESIEVEIIDALAQNQPFLLRVTIFKKPTTRDLRNLEDMAKDSSKEKLPAHRYVRTSALPSIDSAIKLIPQMGKRGVHVEEINNSTYVQLMRKQHKRGSITEEQLRAIEWANKSKISIKKTRTTSKTVGKRIFGTKNASQRARKMNSRIIREIGRRFKKV